MGNSPSLNDTCGLRNLGNTCYMASVLQALAALRCVRTLSFDAVPTHNGELDVPLQRQLVCMLTTAMPYLSPYKFWKACYKSDRYWDRGQQHDVLEFIDFLFERSVMLTGLFEGMIETQHVCTECHQISAVPEPFRYMPLQCVGGDAEIFQNSTATLLKEVAENGLARGFCNFKQARYIAAGEQMYECTRPECRGRSVGIQKSCVTQFPEVLMLALNRCVANPQTGSIHKDGTHIAVDETLLFRTHREGQTRLQYYRLTSLILHVGEFVTSGHYVSMIRRGSDWFFIDDSSVSTLSATQVSEILNPRDDTSTDRLKNNKNIYVLIYQKAHSKAAITQDDPAVLPEH